MTTITEINVHEIADEVNARFAAGEALVVNGRQVQSWYGKPAQVWNNGTLSVEVKSRSGVGRKTTHVWIKQGQTFVLDI